MNIFIILGIAFSLAMDAFAVSAGLSLSLGGLKNVQALRLAFNFGLFQFFMPILGWLAGSGFLSHAKKYDHWVAFSLLLFIGLKMILESFKVNKNKEKEKEKRTDPSKGWPLLFLSLATSIDSLAMGVSLAALKVAIVFPSIVIGLVAFMMTLFGGRVGPLLGKAAGKRAEFVGGFILILIGLKIILEHL